MGSMAEDAKRRDLSMNSLYLDLHDFSLLDPSGSGLEDIKNKKLRVAGTVDESSAKSDEDREEIKKRNKQIILGILREDPLRILRVLRFKAQLSGHVCNDCGNRF